MGAAIPLQKRGKDVIVIDKAIFPRDKTCAGLVTGKTYKLIRSLVDGDDTDRLFCFTSDTIKLFSKTNLLTQSRLEHPVRFVNRRYFDNALVEEYKRLGGKILEGEAISNIDYVKNAVTLSSGDILHYDDLLFADGALSMAHKELKVDKRKLAFGIEAYVPSSALDVKSVDLYFGYLNDGYIWVFPHGDTVCVGAADLYRKGTDYRKILTDFLRELGVDPENVKYIGAFLPYGELIPQDKLPDNVMLLGDAGGFTDPITGEGLYMSMRSGMYAADALDTPSPKIAYLKSMEFLSRTVKDGKKVQKKLYSTPVQKIVFNKLKGKEGLVRALFENLVEDYRYEYRDLSRFFIDYKNL